MDEQLCMEFLAQKLYPVMMLYLKSLNSDIN